MLKTKLNSADYAKCHIDIRAAIDRYAVSIVRRDWEGVGSCYTENGIFQELPPVVILMRGRAEIVTGVAAFADSLKSMFMMIHSCLIETDGETAHAWTVLHETGRTKEDEDFNMFGYYSDKLINQDGTWLVEEKIFQPVQWRFPESLRKSLELTANGPAGDFAGVTSTRI